MLKENSSLGDLAKKFLDDSSRKSALLTRAYSALNYLVLFDGIEVTLNAQTKEEISALLKEIYREQNS